MRGVDYRTDYTAIVTPTQKKARLDPTDYQKKPTPSATVSVASAVASNHESASADQSASPKKPVLLGEMRKKHVFIVGNVVSREMPNDLQHHADRDDQ